MRISSFLSVLSLLAASLAAEMPFPICDFHPCGGGGDGCEQSEVRIGGEWLSMKPRKADLDYAFHYDGDVLFGHVSHIAPHYHNGFKTFVEAESGGIFFGGRYSYYTAGEEDSVQDLDFAELAASRLPPQNAYTTPGNIQYAQGKYKVDLHLGQLESGYRMRFKKTVHATLLGGFAAVGISQKLRLLYATSASDLIGVLVDDAVDFVKTKVDIEAYGPFVGMHVRWEWFTGVGLYSRATFGSLVGHCKISYTHSGTAGGDPIVEDDHIHEKTHRLISHIDLSSGLYIEGVKCSGIQIGVTLGYQLHHFFNLADFVDLRHSHIPDEHAFDHHSDGLGFDGFCLGLLIEF